VSAAVILLVAHAGATWFMAGLIWFVQVVHYAMFDRVGPDGYARYQADHMRLTTRVVGPAMLLEAGTAVALLVVRPAALQGWSAWAGLAVVGVIWVSTAAGQVPAHRVLCGGYDAAAHRRLLRGNWVRTAAWSARAVLVGWMLAVTAAAGPGAAGG